MVGRDLLRAAVYVAAPVLWVRGGAASRAVVAAGASVYLSLPVARAIRRGSAPPAVALIPFVLAVKDVAKAAGCLVGLVRRRERR
jgi:hypothetical protein